jgi:hypothetical protein
MRHLAIRAEVLAKTTLGYIVRPFQPDWIVILYVVERYLHDFQKGDVIEFEYDFPDRWKGNCVSGAEEDATTVRVDDAVKIGRMKHTFVPNKKGRK